MKAVPRTDEDLMVRLCRGDADALAGLVQRYQNDIFRFCLHYVRDVERAKELAQETFIRVYVARARFDESRKFRPWILCIARNLCLNDLKRKKTVSMESLDEYASTAREESANAPWMSDGPDGQLIATERREVLARLLNTLDDEAREIVTLRFFEKLAARDIAEIVGSTEGAIRTRLHRILRSLRDKKIDGKEDL
ncbi:MAG: sigma-70 family RNA polymerase sigma factor [Candidatus Hydrogenedentes bacterium]|nr:sigma-70 family RNA polymerase sigma factor [Candidatus Hydrogenedentota bacterium]